MIVRNDVSNPALTPIPAFTNTRHGNVLFDDTTANVTRDVTSVETSIYRIWCRGIDILFALVGIIILLLLLLILAPLMLLDSPGPIFYYQERVGYKGKTFCMVKLRSMRLNAEQGGQMIWATKRDSRVTRIGRFLRATHIDELPQVVNILRAEMSLIGPRPEREVYVRELEQAHPAYRSRLLVKPGLTGLAQVNYGYGDTSKSELEKLQYDLYYLQHRSIKLDIRILLKTVVEVVGGHGV